MNRQARGLETSSWRCLKRNLFQLTVSQSKGLSESEETNYSYTEILSYPSTQMPPSKSGGGKCVYMSMYCVCVCTHTCMCEQEQAHDMYSVHTKYVGMYDCISRCVLCL